MFRFNCSKIDWAQAIKALRPTPKSNIKVNVSADGCTLTNRGISHLVPVTDFEGEPTSFPLKGIHIRGINTFTSPTLHFACSDGYLSINTTRFRI